MGESCNGKMTVSRNFLGISCWFYMGISCGEGGGKSGMSRGFGGLDLVRRGVVWGVA